jgi:uncharacterized protein (DUF885 family)
MSQIANKVHRLWERSSTSASSHNALIDDGALPLDLLEQRIDVWIKTQQ